MSQETLESLSQPAAKLAAARSRAWGAFAELFYEHEEKDTMTTRLLPFNVLNEYYIIFNKEINYYGAFLRDRLGCLLFPSLVGEEKDLKKTLFYPLFGRNIFLLKL